MKRRIGFGSAEFLRPQFVLPDASFYHSSPASSTRCSQRRLSATCCYANALYCDADECTTLLTGRGRIRGSVRLLSRYLLLRTFDNQLYIFMAERAVQSSRPRVSFDM